VQSGKKMRLANANKIFGSDRETVEEAYPGDVVGIVGKSGFSIGDTLTDDPAIQFDEIPYFAPECFSYIESPEPSQFKRFRTGLEQLLQEGVMQGYELINAARAVPLLGAAGPLQFEIVQYRLETEYGAKSRLEAAPWTVTRWIDPAVAPESLKAPHGVRLALDGHQRLVVLCESPWALRYFSEQNEGVALQSLPF